MPTAWTFSGCLSTKAYERDCFLVELTNGSYTAKAVGASIFTQAESVDELYHAVREAVCCHFDDTASRPTTLKLKMGEDEWNSLTK